jgi:hypothetical protein
MSKHVFRAITTFVLSLSILASTTMSAKADESSSEEDAWQFTPAVYLWGSGIDGSTQAGNNISVDFRDDILSNLDLAFMGAFEVRKSKWWFVTDLIYLDLSADKAGSATVPIGQRGRTLNIGANVDIDLTGWVVNIKGGRNVWENEIISVDLFAGARYLNLDSETRVKLDASIPLKLRPGSMSTTRNLTISEGIDVWDGIIGVKGKVNLYKKWYLPYYADVGTGESDITWQAAGGIGYDFDGATVVLLYRHLSWDFKSDFLIKDMAFSGPMLGAAFHF